MARKLHELLLLAILLVVDGLFLFVVIPAGVIDPEGFGLDQGLPPSFSPRLVAVLAAGLMLSRVAQLLLVSGHVPRGSGPPTMATTPVDPFVDTASEESNWWRVAAGLSAALLFAFVLAASLGFLVGGALLLPTLLLIMGERRVLSLTLHPALVLLGIWLLFEQLLSIRLPPGSLFGDP